MSYEILATLEALIATRRAERPAGSYTTYLFEAGQDKMLKKLGEELTETVIASKNGHRPELVGEVSDLLYHLLVLLAHHEIPLGEVLDELGRRHAGSPLADTAPQPAGPG